MNKIMSLVLWGTLPDQYTFRKIILEFGIILKIKPNRIIMFKTYCHNLANKKDFKMLIRKAFQSFQTG